MSAYSTLILGETGLVAYYKMGEASGSPADSSTNALNTTVINGSCTYGQAPSVATDPATAILFPGTASFEAVGNAALNLADTFSLEAWIKPGASGAARCIVSKGTGAYYLRLNTTNGLDLLSSATTDMCNSTVVVPSDGGYHHVLATKTGATIKLYIDGLDRTGSITNATCVNNAANLAIGSDRGAEDANGAFGHLALYNVALTAAKALTHYQAGIAYPFVSPYLQLLAQ